MLGVRLVPSELDYLNIYQGIFPHGIDIVTTADYFAVGNRKTSFTKTSVDVAQYEEYRDELLLHLAAVCSRHWDIEVRILAAEALSELTASNPPYVCDTILPSLVRLQ